MLFLIFINDLPIITKCKSYFFADDTTLLFSHNDTAQLELKLNLKLEKIQNWMNANILTINYTKTKFALFKKISPSNFPNKPILRWYPNRTSRKYKYVGFVIASRLNWELHIAPVDQKVACGSAALHKLQPYVNVDLLRKIYFSIVYCYLYYAILIWGTANKALLDSLVKLNNRAIRIVCKIHTNEQISMKDMHLSTHILGIDNIYKYELAQYMFKICDEM